MTYEKKYLKKIVGKGENAGNQHFLLFPTIFSTLPKFQYLIIILLPANAFNLDWCKILLFS